MTVLIIVVLVLILLLVSNVILAKFLYKMLKMENRSLDKNIQYVVCFSRWMDFKRTDENFIANYLTEQRMKNVAIYGYGHLGKQLYKDLKDSEINIEYFVDRGIKGKIENLPVYSPNQKLPRVDVVIVTVIDAYFDILKVLKENNDLNYRSLEEIIS